MPDLPPAPNADEALARLKEGNRRFVSNVRTLQAPATQAEREALLAGQVPCAVILSCSDSRVPAELVFNQGLGDLFVIRVAGNIVAPSLIGSVEYAAALFGTRLVVVMGHSRCGAIQATFNMLRHGSRMPSDNIRDIVERCRAPVETVLRVAGPEASEAFLLAESVRANVRNSCDHLRHGSRLLEKLVREEGLRIVGAEYSLDTGVVEFFDET